MPNVTPTTTLPLPPFAMRADEWQTRGTDLPYNRIVSGLDRGVTGTEVVVQTAATQYADGRTEAPTVTVAGEGGVLRTDQSPGP